MSESDDLPVPDELTSLKSKADLIGVAYHPSIGVDKLREKVNSILNDKPSAELAPPPANETDGAMRMRKKREANELLRIRVTCMNPAKKEWEGEIFTAGNSVVGSFTKFIPFNVEDGWHVPRILYNQIVQRQCQIFTTVRDERGNSLRRGKLIKEFAVEVMPKLTLDELQELAQRQAMAKTIA